MKQITIVLSLCFFILTPAFARSTYPRQKLSLLGSVLPSAPKEMTIQDLEKFQKPIMITIHDPYDKNKKNDFFGFYISDFVKTYGSPDFKILRVGAIDGYKVDIPKDEISKANLFYAYKDKQGYLTVDRMGPGRIIAPVKGVVNKDLLLKIGVFWVWQVKTFEFVK